MADADAHLYEYRDTLPTGPCKGRGVGLNPGNRFEAVRLHILGEALDEAHEAERHQSLGPPPRTQVLPDHARTLINHVDPVKSPDIAMRWTINPYRGCEHGGLC